MIDIIKLGETYDISVTAEDAAGDPIVLDVTWSAACRFTTKTVAGATFAEPPMAIAAGAATASIDTGDDPWVPGTYYYDVRLTDPDGHDYWSQPVKLIVEPRNTPES